MFGRSIDTMRKKKDFRDHKVAFNYSLIVDGIAWRNSVLYLITSV